MLFQQQSSVRSPDKSRVISHLFGTCYPRANVLSGRTLFWILGSSTPAIAMNEDSSLTPADENSCCTLLGQTTYQIFWSIHPSSLRLIQGHPLGFRFGLRLRLPTRHARQITRSNRRILRRNRSGSTRRRRIHLLDLLLQLSDPMPQHLVLPRQTRRLGLIEGAVVPASASCHAGGGGVALGEREVVAGNG